MQNEDEKWLEDLDSQIEHASPDLLKAALEHTTKMLDHVYAANDAISQKARWAIGIIMGVMVILLRQAIHQVKEVDTAHPPSLVWTLYGILLGVLAGSLGLFFWITLVERHYHTGVVPRLVKWKATIQDARDYAVETGKVNGANGVDFAYFVSATLAEYQSRIQKGQDLNDRIAFRFNFGLILLLISLAWWIASYVWLNG
jgi:hypothetical protein